MTINACPQCNSRFAEDHIYCLNDGTVLIEENGEQETLVNRRFEFHPAASLASEMIFACGSCGLANRAGAKFCKKCGGDIGAETPDRAGSHGSPQSYGEVLFEQTVAFQSGVFAPPQSTAATKPAEGIRALYLLAGIGSMLLLTVILVLIKGDSSNNVGSNRNTANNSNTNRAIESELPKTFSREYDGSVAGLSLSMSLQRDGSRLSGSASTDRKEDTVEGTINDDGSFRLNSYEFGSRFTGIWTGRIDGNGRVTGEWTKPNGTASRSFEMQQK